MPGKNAPQRGEGLYNVIAIGGGTAGLVTVAATAGLGGRAALIERNRMGGDCLNFGCVPSKALIASARAAQTMRKADKWGLPTVDPQISFEDVFANMRRRRGVIEPHDSPERFEGLGVDVFLSEARFISPHEIELADGQRLRARHFVIAAGSRAAIPPIEGIESVPYFTNESLFDHMTEQPQRLAIIGGGPIGSELGQVFSRLGTEVHLIQSASTILNREDPDISSYVMGVLRKEGMHIHTHSHARKVWRENGAIQLELARNGNDPNHALEVDALLLAAGRTPNVERLNLEAAGVAYTKRGITTDDTLRTNVPHIWAAGDIAGRHQFTHVADWHARTIVRNIMMPTRLLHSKVDDSLVPWATYTDPEVARAGLNETEAKAQNIDYDLYSLKLDTVDRAIVSGAEEGFIKVLTAKGKEQILGVTIVGEHAGDLLHEYVLAIKHGIGLGKLASTMHAYPTFAESARKLGDQFNKTRLTPRALKIFRWLYQRQL